MDRYKKVANKRPETPVNENDIRITSQGLIRNYISYATSLLQEKQGREIVLKGMGQAIGKTVAIAEIMKRNIPELHQDTATSSVSITDVWEPIEEGLSRVEQTRNISMITITLSTEQLDENSPGYQSPSKVEQSKVQKNYRQQQPREALRSYDVNYEESYGNGHSRGQGQGGNRGRYQNYQENDGFSNRGQGGGRGRSWGYNGNGRGRGGGGRGYGGGQKRTETGPRGDGKQA